MAIWPKPHKPEPKRPKRCGRCHRDRFDVALDTEWGMELCLDCWTVMGTRWGRNRQMPSDRPKGMR